MKVLDWVALCEGDFVLLRWHSVEHVDETDGVAKTLRYFVVILDYLLELVRCQEFFDNTQMHLALFNFDFKVPCRVHTFVFLFENGMLTIRHVFILCLLQQIVKSAAKFNRRSELSDEGVPALQTVELLKELRF